MARNAEQGGAGEEANAVSAKESSACQYQPQGKACPVSPKFNNLMLSFRVIVQLWGGHQRLWGISSLSKTCGSLYRTAALAPDGVVLLHLCMVEAPLSCPHLVCQGSSLYPLYQKYTWQYRSPSAVSHSISDCFITVFLPLRYSETSKDMDFA